MRTPLIILILLFGGFSIGLWLYMDAQPPISAEQRARNQIDQVIMPNGDRCYIYRAIFRVDDKLDCVGSEE